MCAEAILMSKRFVLILVPVLLLARTVWPADYPAPIQGDFILKDFRFESGEVLPELKLHYRTIGTPKQDASGVTRNAVLILHGTGGSGAGFLSNQYAGVLFGPGQLLDATEYFIVLPDNLGHGRSSKPSDGLHARFPHYTYDDMVDAQHRLLTEALGVNHLLLVMGTSMGGMHTWVWGERYPDFMDGLVPLAYLTKDAALLAKVKKWMDWVLDHQQPDRSAAKNTHRHAFLHLCQVGSMDCHSQRLKHGPISITELIWERNQAFFWPSDGFA
jgi:homoserine O-acetyltransferase